MNSLLALFILSAASSAHWDEGPLTGFEEHDLISVNRKSYAAYELYLGSVSYMEEDTSEYTEGFRAENKQVLHGKYIRSIYDFSKNQSSLGIARDIQSSFEEQGFEELYTCKSNRCGVAEGWRVLLSESLGGGDDTQFYYAAKRNDRGYDEFVAYYINDLDGQPRAVVDLITAIEPKKNKIVIHHHTD